MTEVGAALRSCSSSPRAHVYLPEAFNSGEGLRVLEPGAEFAARWGLIR